MPFNRGLKLEDSVDGAFSQEATSVYNGKTYSSVGILSFRYTHMLEKLRTPDLLGTHGESARRQQQPVME